MSANSLDPTTYTNVAANTVFNAVLDADDLLAWRLNVKNVVNQHATEIDSKPTTSANTFSGVQYILLAGFSGHIKLERTGSSAGVTNIGTSGTEFVVYNSNFSSVISIDPTNKKINIGGTIIQVGSGSPEGAVTAPVGSLFQRTDAATSFYVKQTGVGNTGWVAK